MKPVYNNIDLRPGEVEHGIVQVMIAPREWVQSPILIDFDSGEVRQAITLTGGHQWMVLDFAPLSYDYEEKPKSGKGGPFVEVNVGGKLNNIGTDELNVLNTLKYHEMVVLCKDRMRRIRLVGNNEHGMTIQVPTKIIGGTQDSTVTMVMECEDSPPFYNV